MMRSFFLAAVPLALLTTAGLSKTLAAESSKAEPKEEETSALEGVSLGEYWYGPNLTSGDLKGRVVLLEFWGYN